VPHFGRGPGCGGVHRGADGLDVALEGSAISAGNTLAACDWVRKGQPLCLIGDSGTGKSHLLIALGAAAAMAGFRVRYSLASKLANELGYMELDRSGAELLFQVLTEREEKASVTAFLRAFPKCNSRLAVCPI
jgi:hypothetical protein